MQEVVEAGSRGLQGFIQDGRCSDVAVLVWPQAGLSCPDRQTWFGCVGACSDAGDAIAMGESWISSFVSHHGMASMQSSLPQFPLMPAECSSTRSDKLSLHCANTSIVLGTVTEQCLHCCPARQRVGTGTRMSPGMGSTYCLGGLATLPAKPRGFCQRPGRTSGFSGSPTAT